jgi:hypothetical protein
MDLVSQEIFHEIYEAAVTTICIEIASDMHRCAKTGLLPYSQCVIPTAKRRKVPLASHRTSISPPKEPVASLHVETEMSPDARDHVFDSRTSKSPTWESTVPDLTTDTTMGEVSGTSIGTRTTTIEIAESDSCPNTTAIHYGITVSSDTTEHERTVLHPEYGGSRTTSQRRRTPTTTLGEESYAMGLLPTSHLDKHDVPICTTTPSLRSSSYDIYGRIPPKEPKITSTICLLCGRSVSAIRFAPHLEKCMGLTAGTSRTVRDI